MLTFFPRYFSSRAIACYVITLAMVSAFFMSYAMPLQFMLFGFVAVLLFFTYANKLTMRWQNYSQSMFAKKLFYTALVIRIAYVVFVYFYYLEMTGAPHAYHPGDELEYHGTGSLWKLEGYEVFKYNLVDYHTFSDRGYTVWLALEYLLLGTHVLPARLLKCVIDAFSCVLMYNIAKRNFGEAVGRMTGIFCVLMPNMWYYCGVTLKETEMVFLVILFVERADLVLHSPKIKFTSVILPAVCVLLMFTFRTALAAVMFASFAAGLIFTTSKQLQGWKKVLYGFVFAIWMLATVGVEMVQETQELWSRRETNQSQGYEWRARRANGNSFAQYATASVFAPLIFTIPFSSMVTVFNQENQMMMNGANFIKNIMSGFTIFAIISIPIFMTAGYLVVLVFSNFAHSERFHFPVLALELMFAAYGVSMMRNKHKRWFMIWLVVMCVANIAWAWIKLAGRGLA